MSILVPFPCPGCGFPFASPTRCQYCGAGIPRVIGHSRGLSQEQADEITTALNRVIGHSRGLSQEQADEITTALNQHDPTAAILLALAEPTGLTAAELERLAPDRLPGTCSSCRLPLTAWTQAGKCCWCAALEELRRESRPSPLSPEKTLASPVRRKLPARYLRQHPVLTPVLLMAGAVLSWWAANHLSPVFLIPAVLMLTQFLICTSPGRRRR